MRQQTEARGGCRRAGRTAVSPRISARFVAELSTQYSEYEQLVPHWSTSSRLSGGVGCERVSREGCGQSGNAIRRSGAASGWGECRNGSSEGPVWSLCQLDVFSTAVL